MSAILNALGLGQNNNDDTNNPNRTSNNPSTSSSHYNQTSTSGQLGDKDLNRTSGTSTTSTDYQSGSGYQSGAAMNTGSTYDASRTDKYAGSTADMNRNDRYANGNADMNRNDRYAAGTGTDNAMTRSEEILHVGKESVEAGKARLHKYVTTERVEKDVNLAKESVTLEREPITDSSAINPTIGEAEYEVNLREERAVVNKEVVPKERVRLQKQVDQTVENVGDDIRKEHIEFGSTAGVNINRADKSGSYSSNSTNTTAPMASRSSNSTSTTAPMTSQSATTNAKNEGLNLQGLKVAGSGATSRTPVDDTTTSA